LSYGRSVVADYSGGPLKHNRTRPP